MKKKPKLQLLRDGSDSSSSSCSSSSESSSSSTESGSGSAKPRSKKDAVDKVQQCTAPQLHVELEAHPLLSAGAAKALRLEHTAHLSPHVQGERRERLR